MAQTLFALGVLCAVPSVFLLAYLREIPPPPTWVWLVSVFLLAVALSWLLPPERAQRWLGRTVGKWRTCATCGSSEIPVEPSPLPVPEVSGWEYQLAREGEGNLLVWADKGIHRVSHVIPEAGLREQGEELPECQQLVAELNRPWPELPENIGAYPILTEVSLPEDQLILGVGSKFPIPRHQIPNASSLDMDDLRRKLPAFLEPAEEAVAAFDADVSR